MPKSKLSMLLPLLLLCMRQITAQIGYAVGFSTPNYFAKAFKAKFNMLPSEYITKMRKKD